MARKTIVELIDDLDGGKAEQTVSFALDGVAYEIDLSDENAEKIRAEIGAWAEKGRRVGGRRGGRASGSAASKSGSNDSARIREWARSAGYEVPDRGRISSTIRKAYEDAHTD